MLTYFIVLTWWLAGSDANRFSPIPEPVVGVYESAQAACSDDHKVKQENPRSRSRIWQLSITGKECKAVLDPEWMDCLVKDGFVLKEGSCEPRQEFLFKVDKP